jgi:hypothetical protein
VLRIFSPSSVGSFSNTNNDTCQMADISSSGPTGAAAGADAADALKTPFRATVLHDYAPQEAKEIPLVANTVINVLRTHESGWWKVRYHPSFFASFFSVFRPSRSLTSFP